MMGLMREFMVVVYSVIMMIIWDFFWDKFMKIMGLEKIINVMMMMLMSFMELRNFLVLIFFIWFLLLV